MIKKILCFVAVTTMMGCASPDYRYKVPKSKLATNDKQIETTVENNNDAPGNENRLKQRFKTLDSLGANYSLGQKKKKASSDFSEKELVEFSVDNISMVEFVHHVFGTILNTNYVVSSELSAQTEPVTLNFQNQISKKQAFLAASEILVSQNIAISSRDNVYYIYPLTAKSSGSVLIGVGRDDEDIPASAGEILQIIPLHFGVSLSIERTLKQLTKASIMPDFEQSALFVQGQRDDVKRVMELTRLLDMPSNRGKYVGLLRLTYLNTEEFVSQMGKLLENEGIPVGTNGSQQKNVALVPIEQIGLVAVFSINNEFLNRVRFWHEQIDRPGEGTDKRYFMYQPQFARARDLGESLAPLFGVSTSSSSPKPANNKRDTSSALASRLNKAPQGSKKANSVSGEELSMVVDERTNTLIFHTTGKEYQSLLPLIKRMDTIPKQIFLEATIAEVTLTDEFKHGVEFALSEGNFGFSTDGAFDVESLGGLAVGWSSSVDTVRANFIKTNSLVNVLSNPTLLVRDGVTASNTVGNEIPLVTSTTTNPLDNNTAERQNIERRQTGLTLTVTPTINTQGVVILEIDLEISNQLSGSGNEQKLLNRQLSTEVVAYSGETIILGGLISENVTNDQSKVPVLGDIPLMGKLFQKETENKEKTELVILVTPKIINDENQWSDIKNNFGKGLENVEF